MEENRDTTREEYGMPNYVSITSDKSRKGALIRCIIGGWFGWHYFYVRRFGRGLVALFTFNFFMIGWILDIFKILNGKFKDNIGQYLRQ